MRYSITINQKAVVDNGLDLDLKEVFILEAIRQMTADWHCIEKIIEKDGVYFWLSYQKIIEQCPLLGTKDKPCKPDTVYRYIKDLCDKGFMVPHAENGFKKANGKKTFYALTSKVGLLYGTAQSSEQSPVAQPEAATENTSEKNPTSLPEEGESVEIQDGKKSALWTENFPTDNNTNIEEREREAHAHTREESEKNPMLNQLYDFEEEQDTTFPPKGNNLPDEPLTEQHHKLCNDFVKPVDLFNPPTPKMAPILPQIAPTETYNAAYRAKNHPAAFTAEDAADKLRYYLTNPANTRNLAAQTLYKALEDLSQADWGIVVDHFISYQFNPQYYQPNYCRDFSRIIISLVGWLKMNKGKLPHQRTASQLLPLEQLKEVCAKGAANEANSANLRRILGNVSGIELFYKTNKEQLEKVLEVLAGTVPFNAEELAKIYIAHCKDGQRVKDILKSVQKTKVETTWLDRYKTAFAAYEAQAKFLTSKNDKK